MDSTVASIVIDWGYTRLKFWATDRCGRLVDQCAYYTKELIENPVYYDDHSLDSIKVLILRYLQRCNLSGKTSLYLSSQMHCLAGRLESGELFISTWNDLPLLLVSDEDVQISNGIPLLHSMPINKIRHVQGGVRAESDWLSRTHGSSQIPIASASSPLTLILSDLFASPLPCSLAWWQSSCLPYQLLGGPPLCSTFISESPCRLSSETSSSLVGDISEFLVFPEIGDLQASTFLALKNYDLLINLGTGSQLIFCSLQVGTPWSYTRIWPGMSEPIVTLSHLPCGRLLSAYAEKRGMSISSLAQCLDRLQSDRIEEIALKHLTSLLFFPGFCFLEGKYLNRPPVSLDQIALLEPSVMLSLWVYQYVFLLQLALQSSTTSITPVSIGVCGNLGGMAPSFVGHLRAIFSPPALIGMDVSSIYTNQLAAFSS